MILRRLEDVEKVDIGKSFGMPEGKMTIQWIFSNEVGDETYHHGHAVRKYTLQPGLPLEKVPFHKHKYVQTSFMLAGRMVFETGGGEKVEVGPGGTIIFAEDEPHRYAVLSDEAAELICVIDCPGNGEDCIPGEPKGVQWGGLD